MRVLLAVAHDWADTRAVAGVLAWVEAERAASGTPDTEVTIVHGDDVGACQLVAAAAAGRGWRAEACSLNPEHGKSAAMIRNESMMQTGRPDLVIALTDDVRRDRAVFDFVARARARRLTVYVLGAVA